jgi:formamidopyrimidine-DNA glycosylase
MPELPEIEITARRLSNALADAQVAAVLAPGVNTMRTFKPPLEALENQRFMGAQRRGKLVLLTFSGDLVVLIHLMSAGRLAIFTGKSSGRDRALRFVVRFTDGRELRLREYGSKQAAWVKLIDRSELGQETVLTALGGEAWPQPPQLEQLRDSARPLHALLRDQQVIAGIGRAWVDEILHDAQLSPYKRGNDLSDAEVEKLRNSIVAQLNRGIEHYEQSVGSRLAEKFPKPLQIHTHHGEPCPRCGRKLEAVFFEEQVLCYCPTCQTGGRVLKDRRLSKILK